MGEATRWEECSWWSGLGIFGVYKCAVRKGNAADIVFDIRALKGHVEVPGTSWDRIFSSRNRIQLNAHIGEIGNQNVQTRLKKNVQSWETIPE
jgi:hypothetical protein